MKYSQVINRLTDYIILVYALQAIERERESYREEWEKEREERERERERERGERKKELSREKREDR